MTEVRHSLCSFIACQYYRSFIYITNIVNILSSFSYEHQASMLVQVLEDLYPKLIHEV